MKRTVLIIEDDTRIANWVKVYFERAGFAAEVTHDGESGLALARSLTPNLIILDLKLPRLDGLDVCRILRRESDVAIIMLTAREAHAERITGLDSGADDYIVKPFDPEEVIARAEAVLRRVRGRVQQVLNRDNITLNETTGSVTVNEEPVFLTQTQIALPGNVHAASQPGAHPRPADLAGLQPGIPRIRPRHRQPSCSPAETDRPRRGPTHSDCIRAPATGSWQRTNDVSTLANHGGQ